MSFSKTAAQHLLSHRTLSPRSQQFADYWLSLCNEDAPPSRAAIHPAAIKPLLPNIIFFQVVPDVSVRVGLTGTGFQNMCGQEFTGKNWLALTPAEGRIMRLSIFSRVAQGSIGFNRWRFLQITGKIFSCEKLLLPLSPEPGAAVPVFGFVDWSTIPGSCASQIDLSEIPPPTLIDSTPAIWEGGLTC